MTRRMSIASALALCGATLVAELPASGWLQDPAPVFRAGADAVTVEASVRRERRPVMGLKVADFELLDNGVPQEITDISYEKLPIDVTVLLDISASVTGPVLDELRRALRQLRGDLGTADRMKLIAFNMRIRRLIDFGEPASVTDSALAALGGSGSSAIFDELVHSGADFAYVKRQRSLMVPDALGDDDDFPLFDFLGKIPAKGLEVARLRLDRDDFTGTQLQRLPRDHSAVGPAIDDDVALAYAVSLVAIDLSRLLGEQERRVLVFRKPDVSLGSVPQRQIDGLVLPDFTRGFLNLRFEGHQVVSAKRSFEGAVRRRPNRKQHQGAKGRYESVRSHSENRKHQHQAYDVQ